MKKEPRKIEIPKKTIQNAPKIPSTFDLPKPIPSQIRLEDINSIVGTDIAFATGAYTRIDAKNSKPIYLHIFVALDPKSECNPNEQLELDVTLPAENNYKGYMYEQMKYLFKEKGDPFVPVQFQGFKLKKNANGEFYAFADSFEVIFNAKERIEELLLI